MPSRSRPTSPVHQEKEKPYDQGSEQSSDEDFVNATTERRPSSRASAASGGSRSSRKSEVISESSSESIDSEEERQLQEELRDADGAGAGVVRGAPVESATSRIMRSVGKGSNSRQQRYASLADADAEGRSSSRKHHRRKSGRSRDDTAYNLSGTIKKQNGRTVLKAQGGAGTFSHHDAETLQNKEKPKKKKWLAITLGVIIAVAVIAAIVFAIVYFVKRKSSDSGDDLDAASNSTSLSDHANSTSSTNSTSLANSTHAGHGSSHSTGLGSDSAMGTHLPVDESMGQTASAVKNGAFDDGKYHPATESTEGIHTVKKGDEFATATGNPGATATPGAGSLDIDPAKSGQSLASASASPSDPTQAYGSSPTFVTDLYPPGASPTPSGVTDGTVSIQTAPNPQASPVGTDQAAQPGSSPSNARPWNPLSDDSAEPTPIGGGASVPPSPEQSGGNVPGSSGPHVGVGPVQPSQTGESDTKPTAGPVGDGAWGNSQGSNGAGQSSTGGASQAPTETPPVGTGEQSQPASPVDSIAPGAFTAAEFKQATHPEPFQTFVNAPATWFESSGHYGACGLATNNTDYVVAISDALWLNSTKGSKTAQSPYCGAEVLLTSMTDGATVNAWVTEHCAFCSTENAGSIDLSKEAFSALAGGSTEAGSLKLVWGFTGKYSAGSASTLPANASTIVGGGEGGEGGGPSATSSIDSGSDGADTTVTDSSASSASTSEGGIFDGGLFGRNRILF